MLKRAANVIEGLEQVLWLSITMLSLFVFWSPSCASFCILSEVEQEDLYHALKQYRRLHLSSYIASAVTAKSVLKNFTNFRRNARSLEKHIGDFLHLVKNVPNSTHIWFNWLYLWLDRNFLHIPFLNQLYISFRGDNQMIMQLPKWVEMYQTISVQQLVINWD